MAKKHGNIGRPTLQASQEKGTLILDTATRVFIERGYAGASIDRIAKDAGVGKPTIYARFGVKEKLLEAVIEHMLERMLDLPKIDYRGGSPTEGLKLLVTSIIKATTDKQFLGIFKIFLAESHNFPEIFDAFYNTMLQRTQKPLIEYISGHQELYASTATPEPTARTILSLIGNIVMVSCTGPAYRQHASPEEEADMIVDTVLFGLLPRR